MPRLRCRDAVIWWADCEDGCGVRLNVVSADVTDDGRPLGKLRRFEPHCCSCSTRGDHNSCATCGACLPRHRAEPGSRLDRRYCSPACRQRAYRRRKAQP